MLPFASAPTFDADAAGLAALPAGASTDGVHPNIDYCRKWTAYLDENT